MKWVHELASKMDQSAYARFTGNPKSKYAKVDAPLTAEVVDRHLSGEQPIAPYVLNRRTDDGQPGYGHLVAFDFDDHNGELPDGYMEAVVTKLIRELNVPYVCVRSGGGHGYHVLIIYEQAKRADQLRKIAAEVLGALNKVGVMGPFPGDNGKFTPLKIKEGTGGSLGARSRFIRAASTAHMLLRSRSLASRSE